MDADEEPPTGAVSDVAISDVVDELAVTVTVVVVPQLGPQTVTVT